MVCSIDRPASIKVKVGSAGCMAFSCMRSMKELFQNIDVRDVIDFIWEILL